MKYAELVGKSMEDLRKLLVECRVELFKLRMQKGSQQAVVRDHVVSNARRTIARVKTAMTQHAKKIK